MEHLASCRHICSPVKAACCAMPSNENLCLETPSPKLLKEIPNLILSGVRIETIHLTNRTTQKKRHINAATLSSPSSCGVHQCCAMATAWRTASSINTCEHPSNQEIACLSTERLECATNRKHVWCNIDSRCLKTWILQLFHMCFTFHWETLLWRPSESTVGSVTVDRLTGREPGLRCHGQPFKVIQAVRGYQHHPKTVVVKGC